MYVGHKLILFLFLLQVSIVPHNPTASWSHRFFMWKINIYDMLSFRLSIRLPMKMLKCIHSILRSKVILIPVHYGIPRYKCYLFCKSQLSVQTSNIYPLYIVWNLKYVYRIEQLDIRNLEHIPSQPGQGICSHGYIWNHKVNNILHTATTSFHCFVVAYLLE
jgi:hypothetical protein